MANAQIQSYGAKWIAGGLTLAPGGVASAVRFYTTSWPAAATYTSATQTWEADANGAMGNIDGTAPAVGDRLIYAAGALSDGIFTITSLGGASAKFTAVRASDFVSTNDYINANGATFAVYAGSTNIGKVITMSIASTFVLDTDTPTFTASSSSVSFAAVNSALASANASIDVNDQALIDVGAVTGTKETGLAVSVAASTTGATAGGALTIAGGAGVTTGAGGAVSATGGAGGNDAVGGAASLVGGAAGGGNRAGGAASVTGGAGAGSAAGGALALVAGVGGATGAGGAVAVTGGAGGATSGAGGAVTVAGGAGTNGDGNGGALVLNGGAKNGAGTDGAVTLGSTAGSLAIGNSGAIATWASKQAAGAATNTIADPGTGAAIPVTASGVCMITTAGAETNTLAIPTFVGQRLAIMCAVYAVGDRVITSAQRINQANNTVITLGAAGDFIELLGVTIGGALRWQVVANDGAALS